MQSMMRKPYPELADTVNRVAGVIRREEESFLATIDGGLDKSLVDCGIDRDRQVWAVLLDRGSVTWEGSTEDAADVVVERLFDTR